jgi:hypothetical protein
MILRCIYIYMYMYVYINKFVCIYIYFHMFINVWYKVPPSPGQNTLESIIQNIINIIKI